MAENRFARGNERQHVGAAVRLAIAEQRDRIEQLSPLPGQLQEVSEEKERLEAEGLYRR